jgi:hypothetical protein
MTVQQSSVRSLQIAFYNARGLRSSRNELEVFADDYDLDAFLVIETKLQPGTPDPNIRDFDLYRSDRTRGPGGGTAIYVRREIRHHQVALPVLQNLEATAVTIETATGPLTFISCYHPPRLLLRENDINEVLDSGTSVIAAGDFNAKHEAWGSRRANRNGRILIEHADNIDILIEAPPEPTYYDARDFHADTLDIALLKNVPFSNSPTCLSGTRLRPLPRADSHRRRSKRREQKFNPPKHELAALRGNPRGKPTKLAVPLTGWKQTASATKLNTRSSITAMIGGKENSNLSPRRTTRSGEWRKRSARTKSHYHRITVRADSFSRTM